MMRGAGWEPAVVGEAMVGAKAAVVVAVVGRSKEPTRRMDSRQ